MQVGLDAPSVGEGAAISEAIDEIEHVATRDAADQASIPLRFHVAIDDALHLVMRPVVHLVSLEPFVRRGREPIRRDRLPARWILALAHGLARVLPCGAGV